MNPARFLLQNFPEVVNGLFWAKNSKKFSSSVSDLQLGDYRLSLYEGPQGLRAVCDTTAYAELDAVFPIHPESIFLSRIVPKSFGFNQFLDGGVGSGILSIAAAQKGWDVTAIDINPRALDYAGLSANLSGVSVNLLREDIRSYSPKRKLDFVIANLPFEPSAGAGSNFMHSDGGEYGDAHINELILRIPELLVDEGLGVVMAFSLIRDDFTLLHKFLSEEALPGCTSALISLSDNISIRTILPRFTRQQNKVVWDKYKCENIKAFKVCLCVIKKTGAAKFLGEVQSIVATEDWIYPINARGLTTVSS